MERGQEREKVCRAGLIISVYGDIARDWPTGLVLLHQRLDGSV